jgi:hypothetical protein
MQIEATPADLVAVSDGDRDHRPHVVLYLAVQGRDRPLAFALPWGDAHALAAALSLLLSPDRSPPA